LENVRLEDPGTAKKIIIDKDNTTIVKGGGKRAAIEGRVKQLRTQVEEASSGFDREKLQERLAKLVGVVAIIKVGAATEMEMKEKKARVEDAMHATRAAVEEGIVPGGGVAFLRAIPALEKLNLDKDAQVGVNIVKRALEEPLRLIASNAGHERRGGRRKRSRLEGTELRLQCRNRRLRRYALEGILDPAKVALWALQNAASIAALMPTTEALVSENFGWEKSHYAACRRTRCTGMALIGSSVLFLSGT
jgi:chaperonin GroEL